jgi:hypothetical protein
LSQQIIVELPKNKKKNRKKNLREGRHESIAGSINNYDWLLNTGIGGKIEAGFFRGFK